MSCSISAELSGISSFISTNCRFAIFSAALAGTGGSEGETITADGGRACALCAGGEMSGVMLEMVEGSLAGAGGMEEVDWTNGMAERAEGTSERLGAEALAGREPAT